MATPCGGTKFVPRSKGRFAAREGPQFGRISFTSCAESPKKSVACPIKQVLSRRPARHNIDRNLAGLPAITDPAGTSTIGLGASSEALKGLYGWACFAGHEGLIRFASCAKSPKKNSSVSNQTSVASKAGKKQQKHKPYRASSKHCNCAEFRRNRSKLGRDGPTAVDSEQTFGRFRAAFGRIGPNSVTSFPNSPELGPNLVRCGPVLARTSAPT